MTQDFKTDNENASREFLADAKRVRDEWSPEARKAAAEARKKGGSKTKYSAEEKEYTQGSSPKEAAKEIRELREEKKAMKREGAR